MSIENQPTPLITPESSSSPLLGEQTKSLEEKDANLESGDVPGQNSLREQRYARIVAATGVNPDYLPTWCAERERETAVLRGLTYPYWTIKDPDCHLVHTVVSCDKEDAIKEWLETEQAVQWCVNILRAAAEGEKPHCAQSWELFEAQGYSLAKVDIIEAPSVIGGDDEQGALPVIPNPVAAPVRQEEGE